MLDAYHLQRKVRWPVGAVESASLYVTALIFGSQPSPEGRARTPCLGL